MADDGEPNAEVREHCRRDFASEGAGGIFIHVFGADFNRGIPAGFSEPGKINEGRADNRAAGKAHRFRKEVFNPEGIGFPTAVHLPVGYDDSFAHEVFVVSLKREKIPGFRRG